MKHISFIYLLISIGIIGCTDEDFGNNNPTPSNFGLFVVQGLDESLAHIDLESGEADAQAVALGNIPNDIISFGNKLYVTNSGYNTIQEIDPFELATTNEIHISSGVNVWSMAFLNRDSMAVTCLVSGNVVVVRLSDEQEVANLPAGIGPQGILVHGERMFVINTGVAFPNYGNGSVYIYNRNTLQFLDSLIVGVNAQNAAMDDQNRLHVVCTGDYDSIAGEIHVIDLTTLEIDVLEVGGTPSNIDFSLEFAYVTAGGWVDNGLVFKYGLDSLNILNDSSNPILTGAGAYDIEVDGDNFFVSCFSDNKVEYRDGDGDLLETYTVSTGPGQMIIYSADSLD